MLCITHLPQIAALAERHFRIEKTAEGAVAHAPASSGSPTARWWRSCAGCSAPTPATPAPGATPRSCWPPHDAQAFVRAARYLQDVLSSPFRSPHRPGRADPPIRPGGSDVKGASRTRFIFVTGGVVSSLGKGIAAASIGQLLVARGLSVSLQKFDPYINVDPGTMSPFQHGEVFVTEDGAETDLDLGHYERFTDVNTTRGSNVTTGAIYDSRHPPRAPGRLPGRHGAGDPAHHRRDQEPHPARWPRPTTWTS